MKRPGQLAAAECVPGVGLVSFGHRPGCSVEQVLDSFGEEDYFSIGVHLMLEGRTLVDVYDLHRENAEKIPLSWIFWNAATDGEYVVTVVLDTEKSPRGAVKQKSQHCVFCLLNRMSMNRNIC